MQKNSHIFSNTVFAVPSTLICVITPRLRLSQTSWERARFLPSDKLRHALHTCILHGTLELSSAVFFCKIWNAPNHN